MCNSRQLLPLLVLLTHTHMLPPKKAATAYSHRVQCFDVCYCLLLLADGVCPHALQLP
jgi:hypothetical protein